MTAESTEAPAADEGAEDAEGPAAAQPQTAAEALAAHIEALREAQAMSSDSNTAASVGAQLSDSQLLARSLAARRVSAKRITEGRWVFQFRGNVIGGFANRVTTLVSAHSRRVLRNPRQLVAHLDLAEVPHSIDYEDPSELLQPPLPFDLDLPVGNTQDLVLLQAYCVGKQAISVVAVVPQSEPGGKNQAVGVTSRVSEEVAQLAVNGLRAVPGLLAGAVNLEVASLDTAEGGVVIGIDETASIVPHHYPSLGPGRAVADAVAEHILFTAAL